MNRFFRIPSIFAAVFVAMAIASCSGSKGADGDTNAETTEAVPLTPQQESHIKGLQAELEKINSQLPIQTADGITLTKMELTDGFMVTTCTYAADEDFEIDNSPQGKATVLQAAGEETIKHLKDLNIGLKYVYQKEGSDTTQEIVITPEEM